MNDFFPDKSTLEDIEGFMRGVEWGVKKAMAHLAVALATIKLEGLFYQVAPSWKAYVELERTQLKYRESLRLARAGELFIRFQKELETEGISLTENMSKIHMIDSKVAERDPMYFARLKAMSVRQIQDYNKKQRDGIYVYPHEQNGSNVTVKGASLYVGEEKVRGLNLNDISRAIIEGKRVVTVFVDDDIQARKIRRRLDGLVKG